MEKGNLIKPTGRPVKFHPDDPDAQQRLDYSNVTLVSKIPITKGHNKFYTVQCNNCKKIFDKTTYSIGQQKCQCYKTQKGAWNYSGHGDLAMVYFNSCKAGAKSRSLEFSIIIEDMWNKFLEQDKKCALTSLSLNMERNCKLWRKDKNSMTASLDRIDNKRGYTIDNIHWVHKDINRMKSDFDLEYFLNLCKLVSQNKIK
jgi:hypothetical protein